MLHTFHACHMCVCTQETWDHQCLCAYSYMHVTSLYTCELYLPCKHTRFTSMCIINKIHVIVVTQARAHCLICTHDAEGAQRPRASGHIRQCTSACVATNILHFRHSKNLPKRIANRSAYLYSKEYSYCDYGILILTFLWRLFVQYILLVSIIKVYWENVSQILQNRSAYNDRHNG